MWHVGTCTYIYKVFIKYTCHIHVHTDVYMYILVHTHHAHAHCRQCKYSKMAEVMVQLDAEHDDLLDTDDTLVGRVKDVKEVGKRLQHKLLPHNAWRLIPFFELFMCSPKDELHQW